MDLKKGEDQREAAGKRFLGIDKLRAQAVGAFPKHTKTSHRYSFRPLVLTLCAEARREFLEIYFSIYDEYKRASAAFRGGNVNEPFPEGTYRPAATRAE